MKHLIPLILLVTLAGCAMTPSDTYWPEEMPDKQMFVSHYSQDEANQQKMSEEEYLRWVKRFYLGWELYPRGWLQVVDELSASLSSPQDREVAHQRMEDIGFMVSSEWAKEDPFRIINTRHLGVWGNALNQSIVQSTQLTTLEEIQTDVKAVLTMQLDPSKINAERYYQEETFEGKGSF